MPKNLSKMLPWISKMLFSVDRAIENNSWIALFLTKTSASIQRIQGKSRSIPTLKVFFIAEVKGLSLITIIFSII